MNIIAVDIGNSSTKISLEAKGPLIQFGSLDEGIQIKSISDVSHWHIVSVSPLKTKEMVAWIRQHHPDDEVAVIDNDRIPLRSVVQERSALGVDRLMAAWSATRLDEKESNESGPKPCVIVDAGTAVTIDLVDVVDNASVFKGGMIFPGAAASLEALSRNTAALPDLSKANSNLDFGSAGGVQIGDDTTTAIVGGVIQSQTWAILGIVSQLAAQHQATVYCTGGGLLPMQTILPKTWHWVPDLIHQGIRFLADVSDNPQSENP